LYFDIGRGKLGAARRLPSAEAWLARLSHLHAAQGEDDTRMGKLYSIPQVDMRQPARMKFTLPDPSASIMTRRRMLELTGGALACLPFSALGAEDPKADAAKPAKPEKKEPLKDPYEDAVLVDGEPPLPEEGAFTFAVLPDTQNYSEKFPDTYLAQTRWIVEQKERRRIAGVFHLGDITNHNLPEQWENARRAMKVLEEGRMPYCMVPGNHDYSEKGKCQDRTTLLNNYFRTEDLRKLPHWGGNYDKEPERMENNFQLMEAAGRKFLILGLEFGPRGDVVRWANEVVAAHKDREVILLTHAFIYFDDTRYNWKKYGDKQTWNPHDYGVAKATGDDVNDGEQLWEKLVSKHENFILTLNGHVLKDGLGRFVTETPGKRAIPQLLVNFQMRPRGGDGWLRLIEMHPDGSAQTYDFSPTRNQRNESKQNQFAMSLAPIGGKA
jgi:predicted phosphodiesterase